MLPNNFCTRVFFWVQINIKIKTPHRRAGSVLPYSRVDDTYLNHYLWNREAPGADLGGRGWAVAHPQSSFAHPDAHPQIFQNLSYKYFCFDEFSVAYPVRFDASLMPTLSWPASAAPGKHTPGPSVRGFFCHHDEVSIINLAQFCRVIYTEHFIRHMFIANS